MQLLDTDVLIDVLRGHPPAVAWFTGLTELPRVPGFVVMELIQDAENKDRVDKAMKLVKPLSVVWPEPAHCDRALADFESFHLSHNLGLLDALIAACALGHSATLLTFNAKHYRVISGLRLEQPYKG
ncbi:MAG TPA: PIN domain-containing protein [Thermoanaerobaculia bacterium]